MAPNGTGESDADARGASAPRPLSAAEIVEIVMRMPDSVLLVDALLQVIWANPSAERLFGVDLADAGGMSGLDLIHPDDLESTVLAMSSVRSKQVGSPFEVRLRTPAGWRLVEVIGVPRGDHLVLSIRDLTERRRWEVAHDADARFRSLIHNAAMLKVLVDRTGVVQGSSATITRLLGHDQASVEGRALAELVDEADVERWNHAVAEVCRQGIESGSSVTLDLVFVRRDGTRAPYAVTVKNLLDDPTVEGLVVSGHDITDRVTVESALRSANSMLAATLESTADGIVVADTDGRIQTFNQRLVEMWGVPPAILDARDGDAALAHALAQLRDPSALTTEVNRPSTDAESHDVLELHDGRIFESHSLPQRIDGEVVGRVWSFRDVTHDRVLRDELTRLAFHDALTGLANQSLFRQRVDQALAQIDATGGVVAVLFIDLDKFKIVNDSLGHPVGDDLLVAMSDRLLRCLRSNDTAARLGGDEFAVLIEGITDDAQAINVAERIVATLGEPVMLGSHPVAVTASVGVAFGRSGTGLDGSALLRNADLAMYTAKDAGRSCTRVFHSDMLDAAVERLEVAVHLRGAADRGELVIHYQPIFHTESRRIRGVEALVRWEHPERGVVEPSSFIPLAEESGLIDEIGDHVLAESLRQVTRWEADLGEDAPAVTVNLSPRQLLDSRLAGRVTDHLRQSGVPPHRLILEITENALMVDPEVAAVHLQRLRRTGVRLAVDDFGTGYSSLSYLERFPIDFLKIDSSFVANMLVRPESSMVAAIVRLALTMDLVPVAEGVQSDAHAATLRSFGCELAQGYFLSRPLAADALHDLLVANAEATGAPAESQQEVADRSGNGDRGGRRDVTRRAGRDIPPRG